MEKQDGLVSMIGMRNGGRSNRRKSYIDNLIEITGRYPSMLKLRRMMGGRCLWLSMVAHVRLDMSPQ